MKNLFKTNLFRMKNTETEPVTPKNTRFPQINITLLVSRLIILALVVGALFYGYTIKDQLWFTVVNPKAVSFCLEGYAGEHADADKKFQLKQTSSLVSPLIEEAKKE